MAKNWRPPGAKWIPKPATEDTPLNTKQKQFVHNHAVLGMPFDAAARAAGYSEKTSGATLAAAPHIGKAIREAKIKAIADAQMTREKVLDGFLDAIAQAKMLSDPGSQIQGWNSIAKMCGYFEPTKHRIEVDVKGKVVIERLQSLPDEELLKLVEGDSSIIEGQMLGLPEYTQTHDE